MPPTAAVPGHASFHAYRAYAVGTFHARWPLEALFDGAAAALATGMLAAMRSAAFDDDDSAADVDAGSAA